MNDLHNILLRLVYNCNEIDTMHSSSQYPHNLSVQCLFSIEKWSRHCIQFILKFSFPPVCYWTLVNVSLVKWATYPLKTEWITLNRIYIIQLLFRTKIECLWVYLSRIRSDYIFNRFHMLFSVPDWGCSHSIIVWNDMIFQYANTDRFKWHFLSNTSTFLYAAILHL